MMPRADFTPAEHAGPAPCLPPPVAAKPRGNNPYLGLTHAQPARRLDPRGARSGCPCHSPAIHRELRCRMHGVRSPAPRTPESLSRRRPEGHIRVRDVRTVHGRYGATARADNRFRLTLLRITRVDIALDLYKAHLSPALAAHARGCPPELNPPRRVRTAASPRPRTAPCATRPPPRSRPAEPPTPMPHPGRPRPRQPPATRGTDARSNHTVQTIRY
jgi:hypothetical protein